MKLKDKFNLSHVAGFFVGVVVTVIFNWIVFKDPKGVTAPGVAALVAMCTFTLALWSAFKVNKWLDNKVNDAAFNQALRILEHFEGFHEKLTPLTSAISDISRIEKPLSEADEIKIEKASLAIKDMMTFGTLFFMKIKTRRYWKIKFTTTATNIISELEKELICIIKNSKLILEHAQEGNLSEREDIIERINNSYFIIAAKLDLIISLSYDEIFDENSFTSPSKKVD